MPIDQGDDAVYAYAGRLLYLDLLGSMHLDRTHASKGMISSVMTPPFIAAVILLVTAVVLDGPVGRWMDVKRDKLPLPLRAPLNTLREDALRPYRVRTRHILEPVVVEALGTDMYLSWSLEDTSVPQGDPLRRADLLVTYDTGGNNLVPHTPDVCRLGAGYQPAQPHENVKIPVPALGHGSGSIPLRVCTFVKTDVFARGKVSVVYTFHCNGKFVATRSGVRVLINDLTNTYAYFSKVEVSFPGATRDQCVEGSKKLLDRVLPVLLEHHWPDFEAAEKQARAGAGVEP